MSWVVLAVVVGAAMILVSKLTRKRPDETAAGVVAANPPDTGGAHSSGDGGRDGDGDGGE